MKRLFLIVAVFSMFRPCALFAKALDSNQMVLAKPEDALSIRRIREVITFVKALTQDSHSDIAEVIRETSPFVQLEDIRAIESASEINGHPTDSREVRSFLVAVAYLERQERIENEHGDYRSNTAIYSSIPMICELVAEKLGSKAAKISCKIQKQ